MGNNNAVFLNAEAKEKFYENYRAIFSTLEILNNFQTEYQIFEEKRKLFKEHIMKKDFAKDNTCVFVFAKNMLLNSDDKTPNALATCDISEDANMKFDSEFRRIEYQKKMTKFRDSFKKNFKRNIDIIKRDIDNSYNKTVRWYARRNSFWFLGYIAQGLIKEEFRPKDE